jgi:hypothetical protein
VVASACNWKQDEAMDATKTKPFNIDKKLVYVSGCENPRKDGGELDRWAENRRCSGWVRVI